MPAAKRSRASADSAFQQITSQITGEAPAAPNRHEWRRFDLRVVLGTTALATGVLVGASLWSPHEAAAQSCVDGLSIPTPNEVNCNDERVTVDNTFVLNGAVNATNFSDRHWQFTDPDDIVVTITPDGEITGFGLAVSSTQAGAAISVDHQGSISVDDTNNPTQGGTGVFNLTTDGGDVTYTGNGSVIDNDGGNAGLVIDTGAGAGDIDIGSALSPVTPTYQGTTALWTNSGTGSQNIFLDSGTLVVTDSLGVGALATSATGDINMVLTGNTSITTTVAPANLTGGVVGNSSGGDVTIESDANVGSAGFEFAVGIASNGSNGTAIDITQTGGTILATFQGIRAVTSGANTGISVTTDAGSLIDMLSGTGIFASQGGATGGVTVTVDGDIEGAEIGVDASISNAANGDNVAVTASESIEATVGHSISATTAGTGNATVNLLDGADLQGGVLAQSTTGNASIVAGNDVTVVGNSPGAAAITAGGNATQVWGDNAAVSGSSGLVVDQTSPAGAGVATVVVGANGEIIGDGTDPTDDYDGNGIFAGNQGTGETSVTTGTGTSVTGEANGIFASQTNAANINDITITTDGPVTGNGGIPFALPPYTDAFVAAALPTTGLGIGVSNEGTGDIIVSTGDTVTGANVGIQTLAAGRGDTAITTNGEVTGGAVGISATAVGGNIDITANQDVTGGSEGVVATATGAGNINVSVAGGAEVTGLTGAGVSTDTAAGAATIENAGLIQGAFAAISGATSTVLDVVNQAGGLIQNLSADIGDLAISVTGTGVTDIDNDGTIRGRVSLDAGNDTFTNSGLWATTGVSDFGAGNDSVTNTGRLSVAEQAAVAEITHLANLESFTNASTGVIDMVDDNAPNVGDELTIDGLYTGVPGSIIQMDLALVSGDPQAGSDLLILDAANPAMGTSDFLFNIVSTGVTATTADANRVAFAGGQILAAPVTVVENRGTLTTSSGDDNIPLARSGLITYDLVRTAAAGGDYQVVSQFDAGLAGGLLLPIPATLATVAFTTQRTPNPITATCIDPDNKPNAQGGWVRGLAGEFNTESAGEASTGGVTSELESDNRTRFKTLQGGFDHVFCNLGSFVSTLHLGVTVGQTWGDSFQKDPEPAAGIFGTDVAFDTFFFGPYAAVTRGNFAAQASLRFDYHSLELSNPTVGVDADGLDVDAEGISGSASMSYDFEVATLTLTPDVGVIVSNTEIDSFDIAGGTVHLDDLWSVMGHVGVTARTEPLGVADNLFVVPFASATLYHEFIEHSDGQFDIGGTVIEAESNRVGTFGQLGIGANAVRLGDVVAGRPTLFAGARFDLQVGERIEGATATVFGRVQF